MNKTDKRWIKTNQFVKKKKIMLNKLKKES